MISTFRSRARRSILLLAVFLAGAALMAFEILAFRVVGRTFGSALRETSVVIAVFLLAMSIGYYAGGRIVDRHPRASTFSFALALAAFAAFPVPELESVITAAVLESGAPLGLHVFLVTIPLFSLPAALLAASSPIVIRLLARSEETTGRIAGTISAISTVGSISGSLIGAFFLIDWLDGVAGSIRAIGLLLFVLAILVHLDGLEGTPTIRAQAPALALLAGAAIGLTVWLASPARLGRIDHGPRYETVHQRETRYHSIEVVDHDARTRTLRFGIYVQTAMALDDPTGPGLPYTELFHVPFVLDPELDSVLIVGLGGGTMPKQVLRHYPGARVESVEVDQGVVDVAREYFELPDVPVSVQDGRTYLRSAAGRTWDAIGIDAFTTNPYGMTIPWHLTTLEFFEELRSHLEPEGTLVFNCAAESDTPIAAALTETIRQVFPHVGWFAHGGNTVIVASRRPWPQDAEELTRLAREGAAHGVPPRIADLMKSFRPATRTAGAVVLTDDDAPVDQLLAQSR